MRNQRPYERKLSVGSKNDKCSIEEQGGPDLIIGVQKLKGAQRPLKKKAEMDHNCEIVFVAENIIFKTNEN
jgi:hypothetical protein